MPYRHDSSKGVKQVFFIFFSFQVDAKTAEATERCAMSAIWKHPGRGKQKKKQLRGTLRIISHHDLILRNQQIHEMLEDGHVVSNPL